jgi:hypothetical protein
MPVSIVFGRSELWGQVFGVKSFGNSIHLYFFLFGSVLQIVCPRPKVSHKSPHDSRTEARAPQKNHVTPLGLSTQDFNHLCQWHPDSTSWWCHPSALNPWDQCSRPQSLEARVVDVRAPTSRQLLLYQRLQPRRRAADYEQALVRR